jgi:general secretion pathway protein G
MNIKQRGFTLIEILVVVVILGILGAAVAPKLFEQADIAKVTRAKTDIAKLDSLIELYKTQTGVFPSTEQGLRALVRKPTGDPEPRNYPQTGYIKKLPMDPWNNEYFYIYPGEQGVYDIFSLGSDGQEGGEGYDADLGNWDDESTAG